jgi:Flp pilus assembly protein TadG
MPWERWRSAGHRDSGAVAVETAFVSMLLVVLLFGIVDSSFLFKDYLAVSAASRAGARMGASQPRIASVSGSPDFAQLAANQVTNAITGLIPANLQQVWVYKASGTTGLPDSGSFASCTVCVKFTWSAGALIPSYSNWAASTQDACEGDVGPLPAPLRDSLGVYVQYKHSSPLGFFFKNAIVRQSTVMWIEPTTAPICK